jgi:hypothetical protein
MKTKLALFLLLLPLIAGLDATAAAPAPSRPEATGQNAELTPTAILAAQVKEITSSANLSRKSQAKLIADAVRRAITAVTEGVKDPAERLKLALELATVAAKAAPSFAATITSTVSGTPTIASIEGVLDRVQAAVKTGIEAAKGAGGEHDGPGAGSSRQSGNHEFDGPNKGDTVVSPSH